MRLLKYAILGLISRTPITGYDIAKEFDKGFVNFWYATHSQIYPELRRLNDEELITYEIDTKGDKLEKKRYCITEKGQKELEEWLLVCDELQPTPKDSFRLKLYFLNAMGADEIQRHLEDQLYKRQQKLEKLKTTLENLQKNCSSFGKKLNAELGNYFVLNGAIMREENYIRWLEFCLTHLSNLPDQNLLL